MLFHYPNVQFGKILWCQSVACFFPPCCWRIYFNSAQTERKQSSCERFKMLWLGARKWTQMCDSGWLMALTHVQSKLYEALLTNNRGCQCRASAKSICRRWASRSRCPVGLTPLTEMLWSVLFHVANWSWLPTPWFSWSAMFDVLLRIQVLLQAGTFY